MSHMSLHSHTTYSNYIYVKIISQYTLWQTKIAVENGYIFIVDLPSKNGDFP